MRTDKEITDMFIRLINMIVLFEKNNINADYEKGYLDALFWAFEIKPEEVPEELRHFFRKIVKVEKCEACQD